MLTQWHLLMEQLQQTGEAPEGLAGDTGMVGTQVDNAGVGSPQSVVALKALQSRLGNQGFKQWLQQQPGQLNQAADNANEAVAQQQGATKETIKAQETSAHSAKAATVLQASSAKKEEIQTEKKADKTSPGKVKQPDKALRKSTQAKTDLSPLITAFSLALPTPGAHLWRQLEQHYLSRSGKQQTHLLSALIEQVRDLPAPKQSIFIEGMQPVSQLHIVQALLNRLAPQTAVKVQPEPPQPVNPNED